MASTKLRSVEPTQKDFLSVATILNGAYHKSNNDFYHTLFKDVPQSELIYNMSLRWGKELYKTGTWHLKLEDAATGEMMSYSRWVLPEHILKRFDQRPSLSEEQKQKFAKDYENGSVDGWPKHINRAWAEVAEVELEEARKVFPKEHIVLDMIMTLPQYQGQGCAKEHIEWGLALADEEKLPVVLEATPAAKGLYLKHGFEVVSEVNHDLSEGGGKGSYLHTLMVRPAKK